MTAYKEPKRVIKFGIILNWVFAILSLSTGIFKLCIRTEYIDAFMLIILAIFIILDNIIKLKIPNYLKNSFGIVFLLVIILRYLLK